MLVFYNWINWDIGEILSQVLRSSKQWSWDPNLRSLAPDLVLTASVPPCPPPSWPGGSFHLHLLSFSLVTGFPKGSSWYLHWGQVAKGSRGMLLKFNTHGGNIRHLDRLPFSLSNLTANYISDFEKSTQDYNKWNWEFQAIDGELSIFLGSYEWVWLVWSWPKALGLLTAFRGRKTADGRCWVCLPYSGRVGGYGYRLGALLAFSGSCQRGGNSYHNRKAEERADLKQFKGRHWKRGGMKMCSLNVDADAPCDKQSHSRPKVIHPEHFEKITPLNWEII